MGKTIRIAASLLAPLIAASPTAAKPLVPLKPPANLSFSPATPTAVLPDHPLRDTIVIDEVADMPDKIGGFLARIVSREELQQALQETFAASGMLAPTGGPAKVHLRVRWVGMDTPFKLSFSSEATVTLDYALVRIDDGRTIFERTITTHTQSRGGDATERIKGNARLAIMANLASAWNCLDKAAYGRAPGDCALTPNATFRAPQPPVIMFVPRFR